MPPTSRETRVQNSEVRIQFSNARGYNIWFGLHWALLSFFDHCIQSSVMLSDARATWVFGLDLIGHHILSLITVLGKMYSDAHTPYALPIACIDVKV